MTTPSESTLGVTRQEPPTESNISQTLSIARGLVKDGDYGQIYKTEDVTLAALAGILRNAQAKAVSFTFDELAAAPKKKRDELKIAPWYTCATFRGTRRLKNKVTSCTAVVLDADKPGMTREALIRALDSLGCAYIAATSTSHGIDGQARYRVIVPLATPVERARYKSLWLFLKERLPGIDPDAKDATRLNYLPRIPQGATGHEVVVVDSRPWFDAASVPAGAPASKATALNESKRAPVELTAEQLADLKGALAHLARDKAAGKYGFWAEVGLGLLTLGEVGRALWLDFSAEAPNPNPGESALAWWEKNRNTKPDSDYTHLFKMAGEREWKNPIASKVSDPSEFPYKPPEPDAIIIGEVPKAHHLCTDLANANRIKNEFGTKLISVAGRFYAWTGTHWARDEGEAARCAAKLSAIVKNEAKAARQQFDSLAANNTDALKLEETKRRDQSKLQDNLLKTPQGPKIIAALLKAEALEKWAVACEGCWIQRNALELLRSMLTFDALKLDSDAALLNCQNGTIDLRTGHLRAHDPKDYITRCCPVRFNPDARAARFEKFLLEVMNDDAGRAGFLRRWYGYTATGETREQSLIFQIGPGGNGKGTLLTAINDVLGEYAGTAAPGLLVGGGGERHPTEIANLLGKRLVSCHENDDGAALREGFLKHVTGTEELTARWMRADFFSFRPTHKLQMLTNHKPVIKGSDFAIWRRLFLIEYPVKFGTEQDVRDGKAHEVRDTTLHEKLKAEREGIFAWLVRGAAEWYLDGLRPPDNVLAASRAYQKEQDRVSEFVDECYILDAKAWSALSGLYLAYMSWCKLSNYNPLGKGKFIQELERVTPHCRKVELKCGEGRDRKTTRGMYGLRLDPDVAFGGYSAAPDPALLTVDNSDLGGVAS
jgi:P4 family phage/plasmid primase-like protien